MACKASQAANVCLSTIDYAAVAGDRILPFIFALDPSSVLYPVPGQFQRFVYTITGHGANTSGYVDLSHFLLVVCPSLTEDMLRNVTVTIDGVPKNVVIGTNVEVLPPDDPDNTTGCPGLKFDFGLDKVDGVMVVSFELSTPFAIGPVAVCVKGGQVSHSNLAICGPACGAVETTCPAIGYQRARICAPVTVTPFVSVGDTSIICCNDPVITNGNATCAGVPRGACTFTITQEICIAVPVVFGANAAVGDYAVQCLGVGDAETCAGCGNDS